jgi:hypothetical protein
MATWQAGGPLHEIMNDLHDALLSLQFRFESFNFTNTPAFGQPAAVINATGAGTITSAGSPRDIQLALKFLF